MTLKDWFTRTFDVYTLRQLPGNSNYKEDEVSDILRNKVLFVFLDLTSGRWADPSTAIGLDFWHEMHNRLQHLYGLPCLSGRESLSAPDDTITFLRNCSAGEFFDFIELSFKLDCSWRAINDEDDLVETLNEILGIESAPYRLTKISKTVDPEVNRRGPPPWGSVRVLAYPKVIRTDDEVVNREAIEPALSVLNVPLFEEANLRFRAALDHYRKTEYDDCLTKCGTSLESVLKSICRKKRWTYGEDENLSRVLQTVIDKSELEPFYKDPITIIATIRNRLSSSHGRGTTIRTVERHIAQYTLNSTAAAILLLVHQCDL